MITLLNVASDTLNMEDKIKTGIEFIIDYLKINGESSLSNISKAIGVKQDTVFEISKGLEKLDKVIITYKLGKAYIKLK